MQQDLFRFPFLQLIYLLLPILGFSQESLLTFKHTGIDDGLSQNTVTCIYQDKLGFMWFGTQDGLNRFDGYQYLPFKNERNNPNSLGGNYIWELYEDDENTLWVGTFGGGLNSMDLTTGEIKNYKQNPEDPNSFPSNRIFSITEHPKGILWIGCNEGLIRFDKATHKSQLFLSNKNTEGTLEDNYVGIVVADNKGSLWLRSDKGLTQFDPTKNEAVFYQKSPYSQNIALGDIFDIKKVGDKMLIACNAGIMEIDPLQKKDTLLIATPTIKIDGREPTLKKMLILKNQRIVLGTNIGLLLYNLKTRQYETFTQDPEDTKSLSHSDVVSLFQSKEGIIWIGTRNGLNKIEKEKPDFAHIRSIAGKKGLSYKNVNSFMEENDSLLWVGTTDGLNLFNKKNNAITIFKKSENKNEGLQTNYILCLFKDSKGRKWIGTRRNGFYRIENNNKIRQIKPNDEQALSTSVHFITEDKEGNLWLGTGGAGLWKYNPEENTVKKYGPAKDGLGTSHSYVFTILIDSKDNFWLGTPTGGLNLFNPKTEKFIYFLNNPENKNSLSNDIVLSLFEDPQNNLWIGTNGGLNKLAQKLENNLFEKLLLQTKQGNDSLFQNFGQEQGFPNEVIYGILDDSSQNLWLSTNKGLVVFDSKKEKVIQLYDVSQGIQSNEFNQNAYYKDRFHNFYFGGVDGFNSFQPDSITGNQYLPPVVITNLSLFNNPVKIGNPKKNDKEFLLPKNIAYLEDLYLSWKHDMITLDFAAFNFISPEKNSFSYQLEGFNDDWVNSTAHNATYTNLDPGDYIFKVKASNSSNLWNNEETKIKIHINNPPWKRWYAYLIYLLLAFGTFYLFTKYRIEKATQKIRVQNQIEKARIEERESFRKRSSRDFHDEAGTKITRISLITELVKRMTTHTPEIQNHLLQIDENLQDLNTGMRDFIWALDPTKDTMYDTLIRFTDFAAPFCEIAGVQFHAGDISKNLENHQLNMAARRHIILILKEALNNCIKHSSPSLITFATFLEGDTLTLSLKDNGKGFSLENTTHGHGLTNMKERAKNIQAVLTIHSKINEGTEIVIKVQTTQEGS
ncbi:MAG: two-component regulator propeller domain-containing protein [Flavobacteriaceae bacterium]